MHIQNCCRLHRIAILIGLGCGFLVWCGQTSSLSADEVILRQGGKLSGQLLKEEKQDGQTFYIFRTDEGVTIKLKKNLVREIRKPTPAQLQYQERLTTLTDTVEQHWEMAEWCRSQGLRKEREYHLLYVIKLDPEHEDARHGLGYSRVQGRWVLQDQLLRSRGYVRHNGDWMLPEEVLVEKARKEWKQKQVRWRVDVRRWRDWLGKRRHNEAVDNIKAIDDPAAVDALVFLLGKERRHENKLLFIDALGRLATPAAATALIDVALNDDDEQVRELSLQKLQAMNRDQIVRRFMSHLNPNKNNNQIINRAGVALSWLEDPVAVRSLIEALSTKHKVKNRRAQSGNLGASFGNNGGGGLNVGGRQPTHVYKSFNNQGVLAALQKLTDTNYGFDKQAWLDWYVEKNSPHVDTLRRGR